jgi:uncharacterized protein HemY
MQVKIDKIHGEDDELIIMLGQLVNHRRPYQESSTYMRHLARSAIPTEKKLKEFWNEKHKPMTQKCLN